MIVQVSFQQSIALKFTIGNSTAILNGTKKQLANRKQSINTIWCFGPLQLLRCWHRRHGRRRFGTGPWRRFVWSQTTTTTVVQCFSYRFMYDLGAKYCCTLFPLYKVHINNIYIHIFLAKTVTLSWSASDVVDITTFWNCMYTNRITLVVAGRCSNCGYLNKYT